MINDLFLQSDENFLCDLNLTLIPHYYQKSHGFSQLSVTRPPQQSSQKNLLFVGASTRPGNGVPLVLLGAKAVAKKVVQKMKS